MRASVLLSIALDLSFLAMWGVFVARRWPDVTPSMLFALLALQPVAAVVSVCAASAGPPD